MKQRNVESIFLDRSLFSWAISALIFYSIICFSVETLPDLSPATNQFLKVSEVVVVTVFLAEYVARIVLSKQKLKFIFSFYGLIDLFAILPFFLAFAVDLRSLRILRFIRLVRILKLARYSAALDRFSRALYTAKEELAIFLFASFVVLYFAAVGIYHFEHAAQPEVFRSIFDCLWWAVATLTTVGYGDVYPITVGGRLFTFVVLMVGLGLVAVPTGIISSALSSVRKEK